MNHAIMLLGFCVILLLSPGCERELGNHIIKDIAGKNTFAIGEQMCLSYGNVFFILFGLSILAFWST